MGLEVFDRILQLRSQPSKTIAQQMSELEQEKYPKTYEPALIHPRNSSVVKIRETGVIDVFVGTDNGIRIDPVRKSIGMFSNSLHQRHTERTSSITKHNTETVGGNWTIQVTGDAQITSENSISMKARRNIEMISEEGHIHIQAKGTYSNVTIEAENHVSTVSHHSDRSHHEED